MAKAKRKSSVSASASASAPEAVKEFFEGYVRHTCGWINVKGSGFRVGASCPRCKLPIIAVERLSPDQVKSLGLRKLSGAALERATFEQKHPLPELQQVEELEDSDEDEDLESDDEDEGDEGDEDEGDEGDEGADEEE